MRLIDGDALKQKMQKVATEAWKMKLNASIEKTFNQCIDYIDSAPTIEPKQGKWIVYEGGWKDLDYYPPKCKCNQCGYEEDLYILNAKPTNFCPNCGARMEKTDEWFN